MKKLFHLLLLASCSMKQSEPTVFELPVDRKQKQRIAFYQKKLEAAERSLLKNQEEVDFLREQISQAELKAIETQIDAIEERWKRDPHSLSQQLSQEISLLFLEERETLYQMIQSSASSVPAQDLLDRILQLITQLSDSDQHEVSPEA